MGVFDTYWNRDRSVGVQIKAGRCTLDDYVEGDAADDELKDGVYFGYEGAVVIRNRVVESVTKSAPIAADAMDQLPIRTKWGDPFNPLTEDIGDHNPLVAAIRLYKSKRTPS